MGFNEDNEKAKPFEKAVIKGLKDVAASWFHSRNIKQNINVFDVSEDPYLQDVADIDAISIAGNEILTHEIKTNNKAHMETHTQNICIEVGEGCKYKQKYKQKNEFSHYDEWKNSPWYACQKPLFGRNYSDAEVRIPYKVGYTKKRRLMSDRIVTPQWYHIVNNIDSQESKAVSSDLWEKFNLDPTIEDGSALILRWPCTYVLSIQYDWLLNACEKDYRKIIIDGIGCKLIPIVDITGNLPLTMTRDEADKINEDVYSRPTLSQCRAWCLPMAQNMAVKGDIWNGKVYMPQDLIKAENWQLEAFKKGNSLQVPDDVIMYAISYPTYK